MARVKDLKVTVRADFPPVPPCPPAITNSSRKNKKTEEEFGFMMNRWKKEFEEWKKFKENNVINNRFEILDL